jgi:hypothetical protein
MDLELVKHLMCEWAAKEGVKTACPPEAKFRTGNRKSDGMLHNFQVASGLEVELTENFTDIQECKVVDEKKFMIFLLRWQ